MKKTTIKPSSSPSSSFASISSPLSSIHLKSIPSLASPYAPISSSSSSSSTSSLKIQERPLGVREKAASHCRNNKLNLLEDLIELQSLSVDDSVDEFGNKLLHIACQNGNKSISKLLLRNGASINAQNSNGQTPLHFSFAFGYKDLGEYLITKGADDSILNKDGYTCYEGL
jgi:ankyrin repeat protein